jgi:hypothetical protein
MILNPLGTKSFAVETPFRGSETLEMANFFLYQHSPGLGDETGGSFAPQAPRYTHSQGEPE